MLFSSLGIYMTIQANVGLAPWESFTIGLTNVTPLSVGAASILSSFLAMTGSLVLREKIGLGTVCTSLFNGVMIDLYYAVDLIPTQQRYLTGIPLLFGGFVVLSIGSWLYIGCGFGCGPRDGLMVGLSRRMKRLPLGAVRGMVELGVTLVGFVLGAKVWIGTLLSATCFGFVLQSVFRVLRFDVKAMQHESLLDTFRDLRGRVSGRAAPPPPVETKPPEPVGRSVE